MTIVRSFDRPQGKRALARSETKTADNNRSSCAAGRQADCSGNSATIELPIETDGGEDGQVDGDAVALQTYTDDEHGYSLAYPADWSVERDSDGGATFEALRSAVGVAVFVEKDIRLMPEASAAAFLDELDADEHVHALELVAQRGVQLKTGQTAQMIECTYLGDSYERWRLVYLFAHEEDTGYTLGIDWKDTAGFEADAAAILGSFALGAT